MTIRQVHRCVSNQPYTVFEVPSQSQKGLLYEIYSAFPDDPPDEYICTCRGFCYRGRCTHQNLVFHDRCRWDETQGPEVQTERQKRESTCPRCGGETYRSTEVVDDDD